MDDKTCFVVEELAGFLVHFGVNWMPMDLVATRTLECPRTEWEAEAAAKAKAQPEYA